MGAEPHAAIWKFPKAPMVGGQYPPCRSARLDGSSHAKAMQFTLSACPPVGR
ncbi:MAG TPA: hypothetical protein VMR25_18265 [Planctomycetaceae bacterium]|nr:hypothetical protein [Planctomycetaceae bacterium]